MTTANVNGVRAAHRRGGLGWLAALDADVLCLQEVRCSDDELAAVLADGGLAGYRVAHACSASAGRSGVAVLSRLWSVGVRVGLGSFVDDGRWIEVDLATPDGLLTVVSTYVHTGEAGTDRQDEKHAFLDAMTSRLSELASRSSAGGGEAVVCGDLNVAHRAEDLKNWRGNRGKSGFLPSEQAYFDGWFAAGWTDLVRTYARR